MPLAWCISNHQGAFNSEMELQSILSQSPAEPKIFEVPKLIAKVK